MYVAEMIDYPLGPASGQVRQLQDRDGDGRYETATVFADKLQFPNGVLAARGGLFVTAAPDLLFLGDADGDGRAERRDVVFTGFGEGNQQLRANGLTLGSRQLDLRRQRSQRRQHAAGRAIRSDKAVSIRGRDFRFLPDGSRFEATSGQSQFGQSRDDWGNRFLGWNTIPIRHALFEQQFLDRNPRLATVGRARHCRSDRHRASVSDQPPPANVQSRANRLLQRAVRADDLSGRRAGHGNTWATRFVGESLTNLVHRRVAHCRRARRSSRAAASTTASFWRRPIPGFIRST